MSPASTVRTALAEVADDGSFKRTAAGFRDAVSSAPGSRFTPSANRYHLYVSLACPWANGVLTALHIKGLTGVIGVSVAHPTWRPTRPEEEGDEHTGWQFLSPGSPAVTSPAGHGSFEVDDACTLDTVNGCSTVRELYERAGDTTGKYTTPLLWDKREGTIVCNESLDILRMLDGEFDGLCAHPERKLFKPAEEAAAAALNDYIYPTVNNGVYRCGFARTQQAYSKAHGELMASLARLERHFAECGTPFLTGDSLTWIDLRLYMTLVRFDPVYVVYFKCSGARIADMPNLLAFVRRCYAVPEVRATTNMRHIKMHYFTSHPSLNRYAIIPESDGPALDSDK